MKKVIMALSVMALQVLWAVPLLGQDVVVFPAQGQSEEQMANDKNTCNEWAVKETGVNPAQPQQVTEAPPPQNQGPSGARVKGAVRGAAIGAVAGEVANDDAGKGASAGAAAGVVAGGMKTRSARREQGQAQQEQAQQQEAAAAESSSEFNRAYSACMEGKGYTVK
jgi:uncharacterized protein YcfJ